MAKPPKAGRKSTYDPKYANMALRHCMLGANNEALAKLFEVELATIKKWAKEIPEFSAAIYEGREGADAYMAQSLYHRGCGAKIKQQRVMIVDGKPQTVEWVESHPPDTRAASLWLRNRHPERWRDRKELTGADGQPLVPTLNINDGSSSDS